MASSRVLRILFLWVAVSVGIFALSGCGKKGDKKEDSTETVNRQTQDARARQRRAQLDQQTQPESFDRTPMPQVPNEPSSQPSRNNRVAGKKEKVRILVYDNGTQDPNGNIVDKNKNVKLQPRRDGKSDVIKQGLVYTGSAPDNMVVELQERLASVQNPQIRDANLQFAKEIGLVQVHYNMVNPVVAVTALLEVNGVRKFYDLTGYMKNDFTASVGNINQEPFVTAQVKCMDLKGGCNNMRIRFEDRNKRVAYVVVRQTNADLILPLDVRFTNNVEFQHFSTTLYRTINKPCQINSVCNVTLNTSETVNGSATFIMGMQIIMQAIHRRDALQEQLVVFTGPLVSTANGRSFAVAASQGASVRKVGNSFATEFPYIADTIKSVALVGNDGNGKLRLAITIRANSPRAREETIVIGVQREQRPVSLFGL